MMADKPTSKPADGQKPPTPENPVRQHKSLAMQKTMGQGPKTPA